MVMLVRSEVVLKVHLPVEGGWNVFPLEIILPTGDSVKFDFTGADPFLVR